MKNINTQGGGGQSVCVWLVGLQVVPLVVHCFDKAHAKVKLLNSTMS